MTKAHIEEFRSTVEAVIQKQVDEARNHSWPNMRTTARAASLTFGSYDKDEGRPHTFSVLTREGGRPEHVWGVSLEGWRKVDDVTRLGLMAIVSTAERSDSLVRHWCFGKGLALSIDTTKEVDDPEAIAAINSYIRSPHLSSEAVIGQIAVLSSEELTSVQEREVEMNKLEEELSKDLKALDESRRRAAEKARDIFLT